MTVTVKTVSVTYERKFNLGDYNSANIGCTLWADVTDDQDLDAAMRGLWDMARENVKAQSLPLVQKQRAQVEHVFLGLPMELRQAIPTNGVTTSDADPEPYDNGGHPMNFGDK